MTNTTPYRVDTCLPLDREMLTGLFALSAIRYSDVPHIDGVMATYYWAVPLLNAAGFIAHNFTYSLN